MSLWQQLEGLKKKKADLEGELLSLEQKEKTLEERTKILVEGLAIQEERMRKFEVQLKDKHEAVNMLESKMMELEKTLKKPVKESVREPEKKTEAITLAT